MKRALFMLWYILWPLIPVYLYLRTTGTEINQYALSVILGVYAFVWLSNQFILAAKPKFLVEILGTKGLLNLHSTMPIVIVGLAGLHRILKVSYGFSLETIQARFGGFSWWLYACIILFTLLVMANTKLMHISVLKNFKDFIYRKTGLTYKRARLLHNFAVLGALTLSIHMPMASSSDFSYNPWGSSFLMLWMLVSLILYVRYRLRGRTS